jgi:uncharacterized protein (TIGR03083 family)
VSLPVSDPQRSLQVAGEQTHAFTALLRRVQDPSLNAIGEWSIGEVATHVSHIVGMYPKLVTGGSSPVQNHRAMSGDWQQMLAEDDNRDPTVAADRIEDSFGEFVDVVGPDNWTQEINWHGGLKVPVYSLPAIVTNETAMHGWDVAQAVAEPWSISREAAQLITLGHLPFLPAFVNEAAIAGMDETFEVRLRGLDPIYFIVKDGTIVIQQEKVTPDCRISADPVEYLMVGYGRKGQWGPILTGKIVAWGRKPWLGVKFGSLFQGV